MSEVLTSDPMHLHWVLKHMMYIGKDEILVVAECQGCGVLDFLSATFIILLHLDVRAF